MYTGQCVATDLWWLHKLFLEQICHNIYKHAELDTSAQNKSSYAPILLFTSSDLDIPHISYHHTEKPQYECQICVVFKWAGENCIMRSFIICTLHKTVLKWWNEKNMW